MSSIFFFSDHKSMKLEIKYREQIWENNKHMESKHVTKKAWVNE